MPPPSTTRPSSASLAGTGSPANVHTTRSSHPESASPSVPGPSNASCCRTRTRFTAAPYLEVGRDPGTPYVTPDDATASWHAELRMVSPDLVDRVWCPQIWSTVLPVGRRVHVPRSFSGCGTTSGHFWRCTLGLGKDFRLPLDARPVRYAAHLAPDLEAGTFEGRLELEVRLARPRRELILHALELDVDRARVRAGGKTVRAARIEPDAESETVTLHFDEEVPAGSAVVDLAWRGKFSPGLRGLYRAGPVAVTQFEAADARRVFPCFDEPAFKARWALQLLQIPAGAAAISNGRIDKDEPGEGGWRTAAFTETPPLSSYLVAFCVGDLAASDPVTVRGVPIRTWALPPKRHLTGFAQECAAAVLPLLEDYFGQPYAYGKLDQIGVPDFEAGAMENAAAITFREVALLLDPKTAPLNVQKRVAEVITHELAHQWFGNLVTMVWWDDLWLNEAFATWIDRKSVV